MSTMTTGQKYWFLGLAVGALLLTTSAPALATIDTFTLNHVSGPCGDVRFSTLDLSWAERSRIRIARGERISVTLYGHGADFAQNATGANISEWITDRGTTKNYPDARAMFGGIVPKGYVRVAVKARRAHGLGNRTVTVRWLTGTEGLRFKIVPDCRDLTDDYRTYREETASPSLPPHQPPDHPLQVLVPPVPNLLPELSTPIVLTRPLSRDPQVIATPRGGMIEVGSSFCSSLVENVAATVAVPKLTWGVSGVNIEAATTPFDVQLIDVSDDTRPRVLDTLQLAQGFPENTPLVQKDNYPGRATTVRVISNPRFQIGPALQTFLGCFTDPGSTQSLDPTALLIKVDPANRIDEGNRENDNELPF